MKARTLALSPHVWRMAADVLRADHPEAARAVLADLDRLAAGAHGPPVPIRLSKAAYGHLTSVLWAHRTRRAHAPD